MKFSFIQITDHHLKEAEHLLTRAYSTAYAFRAVMRHIAQHHADADFIVSTGDLVDSGTDAEYRQFRSLLGGPALSAPPGPQPVSIEGLQNKPMYFLPGNHDPREAFFRNLFLPAAPRMNTAFTHKGTQFVTIDWGEQNKAISSVEMFTHLTQALQNPAPSIILMHHHVYPTGLPYLDGFIADDVQRFWDTLKGYNVLGVFSGHAHFTFDAQVDGIPVHGLRSTIFSFAQCGAELFRVVTNPQYRVVTVSEGRMSVELVEVPL